MQESTCARICSSSWRCGPVAPPNPKMWISGLVGLLCRAPARQRGHLLVQRSAPHSWQCGLVNPGTGPKSWGPGALWVFGLGYTAVQLRHNAGIHLCKDLLLILAVRLCGSRNRKKNRIWVHHGLGCTAVQLRPDAGIHLCTCSCSSSWGLGFLGFRIQKRKTPHGSVVWALLRLGAVSTDCARACSSHWWDMAAARPGASKGTAEQLRWDAWTAGWCRAQGAVQPAAAPAADPGHWNPCDLPSTHSAQGHAADVLGSRSCIWFRSRPAGPSL